jgi:MoaA/NifB/PqqE/SkfB family radical SAM enzyme
MVLIMENFKWETSKTVELDIELTNLCNASCPLCPRHIDTTSIVRPDMIFNQISLKQFEEWFDETFLSHIRHINFCGSYGDPTMAKDFLDIIYYIKKINPLIHVTIFTNGGARNSEWWKKLGNLMKIGDNHVTFSIDGLKDTNHLYRRNIKWSNLIENVKSYTSTGAVAFWDFLVFKHNEHQIENAKQLSKKLKFKSFNIKRAVGFEHSLNVPVYNKKGKFIYELEAPTEEKYNNNKQLKKRISYKKKLDLSQYNSYSKGHNPIVEQRTRSFKDKPAVYNKNKINCKSIIPKKYSNLYISCDGIVFPCCYLGARYFSENTTYEDNQLRKYIFNDNNLENLNLNKKSIKEIKKSLDKIFNINNEIILCKMTCGEDNFIDRIYTK